MSDKIAELQACMSLKTVISQVDRAYSGSPCWTDNYLETSTELVGCDLYQRMVLQRATTAALTDHPAMNIWMIKSLSSDE